ncbi:MAG TPA: proline--tRNA ligase, partial [Actinomycetota bacterium]|nr:proline--tRNA ligase [Actinomycetota bacterium]
YSLLPLAMRVRAKIVQVIREEMDRIGGQEFLLPVMHPAEVWQRTGRWTSMGEEMFRLRDRRGADLALGMTHEEIFTLLALELSSYRELPQIWYQVQTKLRDEPRPKSGLLRVREFTMKDSYSFDLDEAGLDRAFDLHHEAYSRIFTRLGIPFVPAEASSGTMGGSTSVEFVAPTEAGEDDVVRCPTGDYAANVEKATSPVPAVEDPATVPAAEQFATPGVQTIADLEAAPYGVPGERQIKTLTYVIDGQLTLVLLRGDHTLVEQKLVDQTGTPAIRPAHPDEVKAGLGASPGSLGAVGVHDLPVIADIALRGRRDMVTGANTDGFHLRHVDVERDIVVGRWADLRRVGAGDPCPRCGRPLEQFRAVEIGHIFKLGRKYSEALGATVLDDRGRARTMVMGSYGIGVERALATIVEVHHDRAGIVWPFQVAPFELAVVPLATGDAAEVAERLYGELLAAGVDAVIDDRSDHPGAKLTDVELVGIPYRLVVGPRGLADGVVELTTRRSGETVRVPVEEAVERAGETIAAARAEAARL